MILDAQHDVFALLSQPETFGAESVEQIDTHISAVFLAGDRAFKLKRAVRLPFLDFSTLEARKQACEAELDINRRLAPALYHGLVAVIRGPDGRLTLGGRGEPVDWLVEMNRFDQDTLFDRMAQDGKLTRERIIEVTDAIARFHAEAPVRMANGGEAGLRWTIDTNATSFAAFVPAVFDGAAADRLTERSLQALAEARALLEARRAEGRVRRCHGDLHLGNICLFDDTPTLFDAIEFSDDIACVDVLYDFAFLLMDLDQRGLRALASAAMNHYLDLSGDYGGLPALPLFLSCRAAIRAHVAAATGGDGKQAEARRYLAAASAYLDPTPPRLIAVGGLSGSGKSRLGRDLAPFLGAAPGAVVVRSDVLRKQMMGVDIDSPLGEAGYSAEATEQTYDALYATAAEALSGGRSVVADAVFARPDQRRRIEEIATRAGCPFHGFWLKAPPDVMAARIVGRGRNASDATPAVLTRQLAYDLGEIAWSHIDSSGSKEQTVRAARLKAGI